MKKIIAVVMLVFPVMAFAGFQVVEDMPKPVAQAPKAPKAAVPTNSPTTELVNSKSNSGFGLVAVHYVNDPDISIEVINGFARDVKLMDALKQIAPEGWHVFLKEEIVGKKLMVSWKGGRRWIEVLDILANDYGLSIDVDWKKKNIYVGEKQLSTVVKANAIPEKSVIKIDNVWTLTAGDTAKKDLEVWAEKAGWRVVWNLSKDWTVPASTVFTGTFEGAAADVIKTLASNGALIHAQFFEGNKTLVITGASE